MDEYEGTILQFLQATTDPAQVGVRLFARAFRDGTSDRDFMVAQYKAKVADMMATGRAKRLLVHRLGVGRTPLCARLGVPVLAEPLPDAKFHCESQGAGDADRRHPLNPAGSADHGTANEKTSQGRKS